MAKIGYYTAQIENPLSGEEMYVARVTSYSVIDEENAVKLACDEARVDSQTMKIAFAALNMAIENLVLNGHSITLNGLGNFRLTAKTGIYDAKTGKWKSAGKKAMDDVSVDDIKGVYVRFRPCTEIRENLQQAELFDITTTKFGATRGGYELKDIKKKA